MILTDEEKSRLCRDAGITEHDDGHIVTALVDAVESAVIKKLAQSVNVEPDTHCFDDDTGRDVWSYSKEQITTAIAAARVQALESIRANIRSRGLADGGIDTAADVYREIAWQVREKAIEECAKHFDAKPGCEMFGDAVAEEIRALIGKEST